MNAGTGLHQATGPTVLDGTALVVGAAVAAAHVRRVVPEFTTTPSRYLLALTFLGIALSAAGPLVYVVRRWLRPGPEPQRLGDRLWALLGLPWIATAWAGGTHPPLEIARSSPDLCTVLLMIGVGLASIVCLASMWAHWIMIPRGRLLDEERAPWTHRLGMILAVAWPLQFGFTLIVSGV
jgi:hypothetical protein